MKVFLKISNEISRQCIIKAWQETESVEILIAKGQKLSGRDNPEALKFGYSLHAIGRKAKLRYES
jgi:hypothetical protein